uniref:Exostosin GT47 domain-containing protein n=1 Tax=Pseudictyota dubia TaxID=2749911 RepID=A0A7R9VW55_9STRA
MNSKRKGVAGLARCRKIALPSLVAVAVSFLLFNSLRVSLSVQESGESGAVLNGHDADPVTSLLVAKSVSTAGRTKEHGTEIGSADGVRIKPEVKRYDAMKEEIAAEAARIRYNYESAYNRATVVTNEMSWFTPKKVCKDTCCAETVAISLHQDDRQLINTLDGLDLADVRLQHYKNPPHIRFHSHILHEDMLPCLQPGTIIHLDNHMKILNYFFMKVRKHITVPYVLLSTESDGDSPYMHEEQNEKDDLLLKWYGSNPKVFATSKDPNGKFVPFPLGLSKHHPQDKILSRYLSMTNYSNPFLDKSRWTSHDREFTADDVFVKFGVNRQSQRRQVIVDALCGNRTLSSPEERKKISCGSERADPGDVYAEASQYLFGVSPPGAGYDCYRTYELLLLGVIPVVEARHPVSDELFRDLPSVQINDMFKSSREVYVKALREYVQSDEFRDGTFTGWEKLFLRYWRRRILKDAGREKEIVRDEEGREYYQAWKYSPVHKENVFCSEKGHCEVV